ncbi:GIF [Mytilus edulis]|uniref:GIF n=1 Tax=Mytilus edulis TaxID=6550 RepID=A0A8S3S0R7_MYTED|nr:GIF [Mytilus edulis]
MLFTKLLGSIILVAGVLGDVHSAFRDRRQAIPVDSCSERPTFGERRRCAVKDGVNQLLKKRDEDWSWGERVQAEAIIALHLAKYRVFKKTKAFLYISVKQMNIDLLSALSKDNSLTSKEWGRGKLAYYILGMKATCQDPRDFYDHDLIDKLKSHLTNSSSYLDSNKFAYSLILIALCKAGEPIDTHNLDAISTTPGYYTFGVDEASLVYMAYHCVGNSTYKNAEDAAFNFILQAKNENGTFGNEYSTALAVQAIFASGNRTLRRQAKTGIDYMINSIERSKVPFTSLLLSVLPAIARKSLLDIGSWHCPTTEQGTTTLSTPTFLIGITVFNNITAIDYEHTWSAPLQQGQTLFDALINLNNTDQTFSFKSKTTTWGQYITSFNLMTASTDNRQYWQISGTDGNPLQYGASQTFPSQGDRYTFKLTIW